MLNIEDIRSRQTLIDFISSAYQPAYLFFWGHTPKNPTKIDKSCLSNWFPALFIAKDQNFQTAEHYMMAEKALLFNDQENYQKILQTQSPAEAKRYGRQVKNFDAKLWQEACFEIVVAGNLEKFSQHPALRDFLIQTGSQILVEASPEDRIWGIGLSAQEPRAQDPAQWLGENLLGFALMEVRQRLIHLSV